jgi:hypothetical protein
VQVSPDLSALFSKISMVILVPAFCVRSGDMVSPAAWSATVYHRRLYRIWPWLSAYTKAVRLRGSLTARGQRTAQEPGGIAQQGGLP